MFPPPEVFLISCFSNKKNAFQIAGHIKGSRNLNLFIRVAIQHWLSHSKYALFVTLKILKKILSKFILTPHLKDNTEECNLMACFFPCSIVQFILNCTALSAI